MSRVPLVETLVDDSEEARAAGAAAAEAWYPVFLHWAANHANDAELVAIAAFCDGYRAGLKAKLFGNAQALRLAEKSAAAVHRDVIRQGRTSTDTGLDAEIEAMAQAAREEQRRQRLQRADLAQELTR